METVSLIRDSSLAPAGAKKIAWARQHMPVLAGIEAEFRQKQPFRGYKVTMCLHLEAKTACLALVIKAAGARVAVAGSNPLSTQDDVVAALVEAGINAYAWYDATAADYRMHLEKALDFAPDLIVDDGADLVTMLVSSRPSQVASIVGGCEETTTGVLRLEALAKDKLLAFPMLAVNNARCKFLFDNRYGTGQSVWDGIMRTTNLVVAGKTAVIIGYGWCGRGVALRAKGLGARVVVCEVDPVKANEALMDGFMVMPLLEAAQYGDFFITTTGNRDVVRREHFLVMKNGAILANAGHFDVEIAKPDLEAVSVSGGQVRPNIEQFTLADGRRLYLLAQGRLVNLAAGDGHPAEIMDLSFSLQALSLLYLVENRTMLFPGVHPVPAELDVLVASRRLEALGIRIDSLTPQQKMYLEGWQGS